jgi:hypothetical protein
MANCHAAPIKMIKKHDSAELQVAFTKSYKCYFFCKELVFFLQGTDIAGHNTPGCDVAFFAAML